MTTFNIVESHSLQVDYERNFQDGIKAGKYNSIHPHLADEVCIIKNSRRTNGAEKTGIELVEFDTDRLQIELIIRSLQELNHYTANFEELLAFGEEHPQITKVISLGSGVIGFEEQKSVYPCIDEDTEGKRCLTLYTQNELSNSYRLLALEMYR